MLERLEVRGLGIIDRVVVEPPPGLVALTGETGAGKSLLVGSLKLLAGARAQADLVRTGERLLRVEGSFSVPEGTGLERILGELGIECHGEVVLRREVTAEGRSRGWVNDVAVTAATLQRLAPHLVSIHGQHEQHGLADPAVQRELVDAFGDHGELLGHVEAAWRRWREAADLVEELDRARSRRRDRLDAIAFQLAEIDGVGPRPGEDEELEARRLQLRNAVRIMELSGALLGRLGEGETAVVDELARAERELAALVECGLPLAGALERLEEARILVEEVLREVQGPAREVPEDPAELERVESRLHRLEQLMLKYGSPLQAVLDHRETLLAERGELQAVDDRLEEARRVAGEALAAYDSLARELAAAREEASAALVEAVSAILERLAMGGTRLEFRWNVVPDPASPLLRGENGVRFGPEGVEECELLIAANPGEEPRPLGRIASGGELSRVHLALRAALRGRRPGRGMTLLFDEVDTGLGGGTAAALGSVLAELAAVDQVLVVTHLPQVAARAAAHLRVEKVERDGRVVTRVVPLAGEERVREVARMLAGSDVGDSALAHARSLLRTEGSG